MAIPDAKSGNGLFTYKNGVVFFWGSKCIDIPTPVPLEYLEIDIGGW